MFVEAVVNVVTDVKLMCYSVFVSQVIAIAITLMR
jgi:hypothetical protein